MDKTLRTWRLTPKKDSDLWSQSSYRGEVWVRAHAAIEARKLTAQRFRTRPERRRARMDSPWYVRELTVCELDEDSRFDSVQIPCVVSPAPNEKCSSDSARTTKEKPVVAPEVARETGRKTDLPRLQAAPHELVALDIRQAIVALLVAQDIDVPGRWLDVYATRAADNDIFYVVSPAAKLKGVIAHNLAPVIERKLDEQETSWILHGEDIERLLGGSHAKLQVA